MLLKYTKSGNNPNKILKLFQIIGELKGADYSTLTLVKNDSINRAGARKRFDEYLGDIDEETGIPLLKLGDSGIYQLTPKSLECLKNWQNYPRADKRLTKHLITNPDDSWGEHRKQICEFLVPTMWDKNYYATFYPKLHKHHVEPDACIVFTYGRDYEIKFVEIEREDHGANYLLEKYDKYLSFGSDESSWSDWWKLWSKKLELPFCTKEEFKFSVICKGNKTFEKEGWEWMEQ